MKRVRTLAIVGISLVGTMAASGSDALAQGGVPNCTDLQNPIFMTGTTAVMPVIRHFGAKLKKLIPPVTLLWDEHGDGCGDTNNFVTSTLVGKRITFSNYDEVPSGIVTSTCNGQLNQVPDLVINDVTYSSCAIAYSESRGLPANFKEFTGPVQGLVPIVANSYLYYDDITVEELQDIYICGGNGRILTFTNTNTIYDYNCVTSGMRELWARGLGVANGQVLPGIVGEGCNTVILAEPMVTNYVGPTTTPDTTIGYTSTEFYDQYRDQVRGLKVRGVNQIRAYLPDTDLTSTDKINIREGRYTIQGALRLVAQVDANGVPVNPNAKKIIDWMQNNPVTDPTLQLPFDINELYATTGVVPQCAMRVTKDSDVPVFRRYRDPMPCHCSFQMLATGKTSIPGCTACTDSSTCAANQICSHGYCE